ncbi:uncharacterized protein LOC121368852 [Gigantopelta aegis]|uniref:uncharacterized protein LOC121368852 n=1 Tax=Gigantopelta aegis TaxID=1735272 RepID=UPI001B889A94|nr:uncharacterized protein LOC121368852 [Gigantopelta aegis]
MVKVRYSRIVGKIQYVANMDFSFPPGLLPVGKKVIEIMMALLRPDIAGTFKRSISEASRLVSMILMEHWEFCNQYTVTLKAIMKKVESVYIRFRELVRWKKDREGTKTHQSKISSFNEDCTQLFDIIVTDPNRRAELELMNGVKMGDQELKFYEY